MHPRFLLILSYLSGWTFVIPVLVLVRRKAALLNYQKAFAAVLAFILLVDSYGVYLNLNHEVNIGFYRLSAPLQFLGIFYTLHTILPRHHKLLLWASAAFFGVYMLLDAFYLTRGNNFNNISLSLGAFIVFLISCRFLIWFVLHGPHDTFQNPKFFFSGGYFLSAGANTVAYFLFNIFKMQFPLLVHSLANITANICFAYAFICIIKSLNPEQK